MTLSLPHKNRQTQFRSISCQHGISPSLPETHALKCHVATPRPSSPQKDSYLHFTGKYILNHFLGLLRITKVKYCSEFSEFFSYHYLYNN